MRGFAGRWGWGDLLEDGSEGFAGTVLFVGGLDFVLQSWGLNSGPHHVLG